MSSKGPDKVIDFRTFGDRPAKGLHTSLYIGSKLDAKSEGGLREKNIKYILNCTPTRNVDPEAGCPNFFEGKNPLLTYKRIAIFDNRGEDILGNMEAAISFIEQGKHYSSVLVHCNKGVSRSASFVLGYLMKTGRLRLTEAMEFLKSKRSICQPNDSFMTQLKTYDERLEKLRVEVAAKDQRHGTSTISSSSKKGGGGGSVPTVQGPSPLPSSPNPPVKGPVRPPAAVAGPSIGLSIGPTLPPPPSSSPTESSATTPPPASPPCPQEKKRLGPADPPPAPPSSASGCAAIGPRLPSSASRTSTATTPATAATIGVKRSVGPSLPPGLAKVENGDDEEEANKRAKT